MTKVKAVLDEEAARIKRPDAKPEAARIRRPDAKPEAAPAKQEPVGPAQPKIKPVTRLSESYWVDITKPKPHHNQVYPLPADLDFNRFLVGAMEESEGFSFQFLYNDNTLSTFDISGMKGGIANYKECAVKPQDHHRIHKVSLMFEVTKDSDDGLLVAFCI